MQRTIATERTVCLAMRLQKGYSICGKFDGIIERMGANLLSVWNMNPRHLSGKESFDGALLLIIVSLYISQCIEKEKTYCRQLI